jgi:hypothetical protein
MYKVPHLENNSYLYADCPFTTSPIKQDYHDTSKISSYKDELELAGHSKNEILGRIPFAYEKKGNECFSSETFNMKPLTEIKGNRESHPVDKNWKNDEKYSQPTFQTRYEDIVNKENFIQHEKFQIPLKKPGILKNPEKNYQENFLKNDDPFILPSFRSENFRPETLNKETFADSLLNELEKSHRPSQENPSKIRDSKPANFGLRCEDDWKKPESYAEPLKPLNQFECSHCDFSTYSRISENSSHYEDISTNSKSRSGNSLQPSYRNLRPSRDIWLNQVAKAENSHKNLDFSKLNRFRSTSNKSTSKTSKNSNLFKASRGPRQSISYKPRESSKKTPRSACNSKERSSAEKEVFVEVMMKVLKNHAKNCKALRQEIDRVKYSKFFDVV